MSQIKHTGKYFILGRQGRDIAKISETQLLECLEILRAEMQSGSSEEIHWGDAIEYLQDRKES